MSMKARQLFLFMIRLDKLAAMAESADEGGVIPKA